MAKTKIVSNGKLDMIGVKKIGKSLLITIIAAIIGFVGDSMNVIDYGSAESLIATVLPFIVASANKWLGKYESK